MNSKLSARWLTAWLFVIAAGWAGAQQPRVLRDLAYGPDERNRLDLYLPESGAAPRPLVIWIHGGAWQAGSKEHPPAERLLAHGFAVASINYRLTSTAIFPAQIEDCQRAVRWLRAHAREYGLDPEHFGAWGASAGGHLAAMVGTAAGKFPAPEDDPHRTVSDRVQAVCDFYGPTDLLQMDAQAIPESRMRHDPPDSPESRLVGGAIQEHRAEAARANPITYVDASAPPFLIAHGQADPLVPPGQSELLHAALRGAGTESTLHLLPGAGHGGKVFDVKVPWDEFIGFFTRHLRAPSQSNPPATMNAPSVSLGCVILYVNDVAASLAFYENAFGLTRRFYNNDAGKEYGEMESGACRLAFYSRKLIEADPALKGAVLASADQPPQGFEIALLTADVPALFERAVKAGAVALAKPETKPWGQTVAWVRSKDGHVIELATPMP